MAISKFYYLDQVGVQKMATEIFKDVNTRIKERITVANSSAPEKIDSASFTDDSHVLSAKAILSYVGNLSNYAAMDGTEATVVGKIKEIELTMSALTHLTYQVVTGDIETQVPVDDANTDVIYLQHDAPSIWVANDGYVMHDASTRAYASDGSGTYYAYYNATQGKYFRSDGTTVSTTELTADNTIFSDTNTGAAYVEDTTYNLYIAIEELNDDKVRTGIKWLCVGDTTLTLNNYWSKTDADVVALRDLMMDEITEDDITSAVQAAFNATTPIDI
jgi:hypothetical protein